MKSMTSAAPTPLEDGRSRARLREEAREARYQEAVEAAERRALRIKGESDIVSRVEAAKTRLSGRNAADTIQILDSCSMYERDVFLLAEELGQNRKTVLRGNKSKKEVREAYIAATQATFPEA